jgi:hypothetical protein
MKNYLYLLAGLALAGCQTTDDMKPKSGYHTLMNKTVVLGHVNNVFPDCRPDGVPTVRTTVEPANGTMIFTKKVDYPKPGFTSSEAFFKCNKVRILGTSIAYKPNAGFIGSDTATVEYIYPSGTYYLIPYNFHVK